MPGPGTYVREVILENFMSHVYSRVRLSPGLNVILGPNGSGKSSIVLALSVALGQTRTERSRRLRDLIRRGERMARVTVVLDNSPRGGRRPVPFSRSDEVRISRYLREDGEYWFELDYKTIDKSELVYRLSSLGIDPDNPLIIMHQGTISEFAALSPRDRLRLVEGAAGLSGYRERLREARLRLSEVAGEEEAVRARISRVEEGLRYWEGEYARLLEKRRLLSRAAELRTELAWARYEAKAESVRSLGERVGGLRSRLREMRSDLEAARGELSRLRLRVVSGDHSEAAVDALIGSASRVGALGVRVEVAESELSSLAARLGREEGELARLREEAEAAGERPAEVRPVDEVEEDLRVTRARLQALADVSDDVERAYQNLLQNLEELRERARRLEENRETVLRELEERSALWRRRLRDLISDVDRTYSDILARMGGRGSVRLVNLDDPDEAGIEIVVGWGGEPSRLDPYVHSGGERVTAIVCFLLALQRHIRSPIRVVDEFDVHLDPLNREALMRGFIDVLRDSGGQSLLVTPGRPVGLDEGVRVLVVQKVAGRSVVGEG